MERSSDEIAEIERHKYFLSEKHGYDVGWETAEQDWEENFAEQWRREEGQSDWQGSTMESCTSESCHSDREPVAVPHLQPDPQPGPSRLPPR